MKKKVSKRKLNAKTSHSKLMLQNLFRSLMTHGKIETTLAKAKVLKSYSDEQIGYAHQLKVSKDLNPIIKRIGSPKVIDMLFDYVAYLKKIGRKDLTGYSTLVRTRYRVGDDSLMAEVKLIDYEGYMKAKKGKKSVSKPKRKVVKTSAAKPSTTAKRGKPSQGKKKDESAGKEKGNVISKLGDRFLGRKSQGPQGAGQGRARSRSGL